MPIIGFKTQKPRQFNYRPLFYDKKQDELEEKLKKVREGNPESPMGDLRLKIEQSWKKRKITDSKSNKSMRSLAIAIALVLLLLYLIFFI